VDNLFDWANAIVKVQLPPYFYAAWTVSRLVPANKVDLDDLPAGLVPACRPVIIGSAE